jgi:hypothetical protein
VKYTFKLKQIDVFEMVWEYSFESKKYKALDKVFSRTDHPILQAVVLRNEIIGDGRLNSIARYFNYLGICIIVMIQVFG